MKETGSSQLASRTILVKGILITLLGVVHIIGTFTFEPHQISGQGTAILQRDYLMWYCATGVFILFMGLVDLLCYKGLKSNMNLAWQIAIMSSFFTAITGLSGVFLFGISPPLLLLVAGMTAFIILVLSRGRSQAC